MKKKKMKIVFFLIILLFIKVLIFAQKKNDKPTEGCCKTIVGYLLKEHGNDSVAIDEFKYQYHIINDVERKMLLKKNHVEMIEYLNSEEGLGCFCRSRIIISIDINSRNVLLDTTQTPSFDEFFNQ